MIRVHVIDLTFLLPTTVITGVLAWRGHASGLFFVRPLLEFQSVLVGTSVGAAMVHTTAEASKLR